MAEAVTRVPAARFGELLDWTRRTDGWEAFHAGRTLRLVKVGRDEASDIGTRPGWHLDRYPGQGPGGHQDGPGLGPHIGGTLPAARRLAEAWALTPPADHWPAGGAPSIIIVLGSCGAAFRAPSGMRLVAGLGPGGAIGIHASQDGRWWRDCPLVGQVRPVADRTAVTVTVTWQPETPDGIPAGPERHCWQAAARVVAARAAAGDWPGGTVIPWPGKSLQAAPPGTSRSCGASGPP